MSSILSLQCAEIPKTIKIWNKTGKYIFQFKAEYGLRGRSEEKGIIENNEFTEVPLTIPYAGETARLLSGVQGNITAPGKPDLEFFSIDLRHMDAHNIQDGKSALELVSTTDPINPIAYKLVSKDKSKSEPEHKKDESSSIPKAGAQAETKAEITPYAILGIPNGASDEQILGITKEQLKDPRAVKKAYIALARNWHPDKINESDKAKARYAQSDVSSLSKDEKIALANEVFKIIDAAYQRHK